MFGLQTMARFFDVIPVLSECKDIWCRCRIKKSIVLIMVIIVKSMYNGDPMYPKLFCTAALPLSLNIFGCKYIFTNPS